MNNMEFPGDPLESWWPYIISITIGIVIFIRNVVGGIACPSSANINGKNVVITGGASGIGFETAKELAQRGGNIIIGCRDIDKAKLKIQQIKDKNIRSNLTLMFLDLCSTKSIKEFASKISRSPIDILINNAGVALHPYKITEEGHEIHMSSNYLGHFQLTHLLLDNLKKSKQGRIINIAAGAYQSADTPLSCIPDRRTYAPREWFSQSKFAVILMTKYLAQALKGTKITVNAVNPGLVRSTQHNRHSILMRKMTGKIFIAPWIWLFMKSPKQGSQTAIYLATDPKLCEMSGKFFSNCEETELSEEANNFTTAKAVYEKTCELLKTSALSIND